MSELAFAAAPDRAALRRGLRQWLTSSSAPLRILAEDLLGERAPIDLVAADARGQVVLILVAEPGEDAAMFTCALAQIAWVQARVGDWLKLSPRLDVRPEAGARALLLCPRFSAQTVSAAASLEPHRVELVLYRPLQAGARGALWIEPLEPAGNGAIPSPHRPPPASPSTPFRSGLSEEDLDLTLEERREFD